MTDQHNQDLILDHTRILAKIPEQIETICMKLARIEKFIDEKFAQRDRELELAKVEMDRRLDGLNHLNTQLVQTRQENMQKIQELHVSLLAVKDTVTKLEGRVDNLSSLIALKQADEARREGKVEGMGLYQVIFITAMVSGVMGIFLHYVLKF